MGDWTFLSNYGHVLVGLARNRDARLRDVAEEVGLTERAVQKIVRDLQQAGYLEVTKQGRCNRYRINRRKGLRHALESHCTVGKLLALVARQAQRGQPVATEPSIAATATTLEPALDTALLAAPERAEQREQGAENVAAGKDAGKVEDQQPADEKKEPPPDSREQGSLF